MQAPIGCCGVQPFSKYFAIRWFAFSLKYIPTTACWVWFSFDLWHLVFDPCIELLPFFLNFMPDFGITPSPLHSQSHASIISSTSSCSSFTRILCYHSWIAVYKKWLSFLEFYQRNRQCCHQFFCCKIQPQLR